MEPVKDSYNDLTGSEKAAIFMLSLEQEHSSAPSPASAVLRGACCLTSTPARARPSQCRRGSGRGVAQARVKRLSSDPVGRAVALDAVSGPRRWLVRE